MELPAKIRSGDWYSHLGAFRCFGL